VPAGCDPRYEHVLNKVCSCIHNPGRIFTRYIVLQRLLLPLSPKVPVQRTSPAQVGSSASTSSIPSLSWYVSLFLDATSCQPNFHQKLVELVPALQTTSETLERARAFASACGKEVTQSQDVPGFVSNALLCPFLNEAVMTLEKVSLCLFTFDAQGTWLTCV
jgi:hypothetical protein